MNRLVDCRHKLLSRIDEVRLSPKLKRLGISPISFSNVTPRKEFTYLDTICDQSHMSCRDLL